MKDHFMPVGKPAPPRPRRPEPLTTSVTSLGFIFVTAFLKAAKSAILFIDVELVDIGNFPVTKEDMFHYLSPPIAFFRVCINSIVLSTVIFS